MSYVVTGRGCQKGRRWQMIECSRDGLLKFQGCHLSVDRANDSVMIDGAYRYRVGGNTASISRF